MSLLPSSIPIMIRIVISSHFLRISTCAAVQKPHKDMHPGTHFAIPYLLPKAAPTGCRITKTAKKHATAILRSSGWSPASFVKFAVSAFPIFERSRELRRNRSDTKGSRIRSSLSTVRKLRPASISGLSLSGIGESDASAWVDDCIASNAGGSRRC